MTTEPSCAPPPTVPRAPTERLPALACDTHIHVFGPQSSYPLDPRRNYTPHECSLASYRRLADALGAQRAVLIQPSVYGTDNAALMDALAQGGDSLRGIVVVGADIGDAQLDAMHAAGVRGLRLNLVNPQMLSVSDAVALCGRVADRGWHLELQMRLAHGGTSDLARLAASLPVPLVIDHMGLVQPEAPAPQLLRLLEQGRCWLKVSAPYRLPGASGGSEALDALVRTFVSANPGRLLWGSDWPHTEQPETTPDAADWVERLFDLVPDAACRQQIFVDNPALLYQF